MTIAVAALFPWGRLRDTGIPLEQAVILASDSRFTLSGGVTKDSGRKIYPLSSDAVAVYAGDVLSAQRGISDIKDYLRRRAKNPRQNAAAGAGWFLRQAYEQERLRAGRKERMKLGPLHVLVGVCRPDGSAEIVRYSSPTFSALYVVGVDAVGWPADIASFRSRLEAMQDQRWDESQEGMKLETDPLYWRYDVVLGIRGALENNDRSPTIGGLIQSVIVTKQGWSEPGVSWVKEGDDPLKNEGWENLTVSIGAVDSYQRAKPSPQPAAEVGLVYAHIAD